MKNKLLNYFKHVCVLSLMLLYAVSTVAQDRKVTGKVVGVDNQGIPGVSIMIKGTRTGTTSDASGSFSINSKSSSDVLVFSGIGFKAKEVSVGGQTTLNVVLSEDVSALEEVIVTGYATTNKKESTAAISTVKAKDLTAVPSGNVEQQLQGRVTGVTVITNGQPGTSSIIRVRGFGALGGNEPLYVVDGVPVGSTDFLSPDDIESTTVLKDAAAASIYGARAANGVIVYTTKKGTKKARKLEVSYDGLIGFTDPNVAGAPKMLSPQEQADWTQQAYRNNAAANGTAVQYTHPQYGSSATATLPDYLYATGVGSGIRGTVDINALRAAYAANPGNTFLIKPNKAGTNWYDEITRVAPIQRHSLGFSGGTESSRYYIGLGVQDQSGILLANSFKRYSFRANTEFDLSKKVRIGENLQFTYRSVVGQAGGNNGLGIADSESEVLAAYRMPTIIPVFDEFGSYASTIAQGFNNPRNPVRRLMLNNSNDGNFNVNGFGNIYLEVDPIENLTLRSSIGGQYNNYYYKDYNYRYLGDSEPEASNSFSEGTGYSFSWVFSNTASYKLKVDKHAATIFGGIEALNTGVGRNIAGSGINPFSMDLDYVNLSVVQNPVVNSSLFSGVNFYSLFGKVDYSFNDKYYLTALVRRDGSSRFGANSRIGVFPAFSAAWRVTSEEFMKEIPFISDLKIRGGWGQMGNSNNVNPNNQYSLYASDRGTSFYPISGTNNGADAGFYRSRIGNPDAKWETAVTTNIGIDATLLNGRFEVVLDWWRKDTKDLLFQVPLPGVVGASASAPSVNIASMMNSGIDFQIINKGKLTKDLKYDLTWNSSFLKNEISSLAPNVSYFEGTTYRGISPIRNAVGQSISSFFGYEVIGYFASADEVKSSPAQDGAGVGRFKYKDLNGDGKITPDDRTFIGSPVPTYTGGVNIGLQYKNFDFSTYIYTSLGNKIFNMSKWFTDFFGTFEGSGKGVRAKDSWTPALGNSAQGPIWESASNLSTSGASNSWYVEDGSYLRMQNLSIGYTVPKSALAKLGLSRARISVSANNIFTVTKYKGLDPGVGGAVDTNFGIDVGNYPVTRSFNVGLNLGF
ncbi:TonB-dependent receptor [Cellulophaga sp. BC115SP]|uniref:SusC/RagA family TonB-linked outer membrane protein n=1 Tax=Cellulophaga sp. BC115SP TaxID=2683263 RepID=UPI001412F8E3|nr:TonB-dependent receptor [Cellulophaga sp. BC115SP]NBB27655.1 SusC/RagA family TonB-linked outer membrane protein [Cellulophaga sp. BC115SP]